jgi:hypothetical protein
MYLYADELLLYPDKYLDPNLLAQHYNHNVAWDTTYSRADLLLRPNTDGRVMITGQIGKTIDSATLAGDQLQTLAHGLGQRPGYMQVSLLCATADAGYAVGDEIFEWSNYYIGAGYNYQWSVFADATNVYTSTATNGHSARRKDTGAGVVLTAASWKYRIRLG